MRKQGFILSFSCLAAFFTACDKAESDYPSYISFSTVGVFTYATDNYFFVLDDGTTVYPGDKARVSYNAYGKEGNRAVIYYNFLPQAASGFDRSIALYDIVDIPSKPVVAAENDIEVLVLGDTPIGIQEASLNGKWLDICCYYYAPINAYAQSNFSVVDNRTVDPPEDMPEGYTYLELRLNAGSKTQGPSIRKKCISFRLGLYSPEISGSKGIYLKTTPPDGETTYLKLDYPHK